MKTSFAFVMAVCLALTFPMLLRGGQMEVLSSNHMAVCEARSDFIGEVEVVGTDGVRKLVDAAAPDLTLYGHLVTLRIKNAFFWRQESTNRPNTIYIYREGAVGGRLRDPFLKTGDKCVVFLKQTELPVIVSSGQLTVPQLPKENYFIFAILPERNMPLKKACIDASNSNGVAMVGDYFDKRAKQRSGKRK